MHVKLFRGHGGPCRPRALTSTNALTRPHIQTKSTASAEGLGAVIAGVFWRTDRYTARLGITHAYLGPTRLARNAESEVCFSRMASPFVVSLLVAVFGLHRSVGRWRLLQIHEGVVRCG